MPLSDSKYTHCVYFVQKNTTYIHSYKNTLALYTHTSICIHCWVYWMWISFINFSEETIHA